MNQICEQCLRLQADWNAANEYLTDTTSALTGLAIVGDLQQYACHRAAVEAARLRVENARSALQLHRSTHHEPGDDLSMDDETLFTRRY